MCVCFQIDMLNLKRKSETYYYKHAYRLQPEVELINSLGLGGG